MCDRAATECEVEKKEIAISPEMIEAGGDVYCSMFTAVEEGRIPSLEMIKKIFLAMAAADNGR